MKIGVMGAGAIGCFVGGHLARADKGVDVVFVGRPAAIEAIDEHGLTLVDKRGTTTVKPAPQRQTATSAEALRGCDVVLVAVKSGQTDAVARDLAAHCRDAVVVSLQNGVQNAARLREQLPHVVAGVVGFNVVSEDRGTYRKTTTGLLAFGADNDPRAQRLFSLLQDAGFDVDVSEDIAGVQWSKLVMNLNNAVSALTDAPTRTLIFEARYRRIVAAIMKEAVDVFRAAGVKPKRLGPLPVTLFPALLSLPSPVVRVLASAQIRIDPEARSSMWEDLQRHRLTEVDELNGEIVRLAERAGTTAPLSSRICELVHAAEARKTGSPQMTAEDLWLQLTNPKK